MLEHICCISLITVDKIQQDDLLKVISAIQAQLINKYKSIKEKLLNATPASILTSSVWTGVYKKYMNFSTFMLYYINILH